MKYFLSTSLDREMRFYYLGDYVDPHEPSLIPVLIEIHLENKICSSNCVKPFANITEQSYFAEAEKEVLFMVSTYFQVDDVRRGDEGTWHIRLGIE
ncbi:unnamed protein product [Rotaria sp. Silwood2]|nr:unnamed protein product [Rotaria sp. Silwood2]CAF3152889.1 unnamed protein product [Rotaria sp. Silwood2]CAF3390006.1 unnamed protein product [Rotaria sp. Silwood2]CAF3954805.1 unnamed protein product [Rotaria sp. Silwood2]CAF4180410.1 unnamed protein product [Rotaria sp. Silwood2]